MQLKLTLLLQQPIDQYALAQFYRYAAQLEGAPVARELTDFGDGGEAEGEVSFYESGTGDQLAEAEFTERPSAEPMAPGDTPPKRRGRKPRAALTPEPPAPAPPAPAPPGGAPQPPFPVEPSPKPSVAASPPVPAALGMPPFLVTLAPAAPAPAAPAPGPTPPAMPSFLAPPVAAGTGGDMALDEFRAACVEVQKAKPGLPFNIMRASTWPDGSTKGWASMTLESVPAAERVRTIEAMQGALLAG